MKPNDSAPFFQLLERLNIPHTTQHHTAFFSATDRRGVDESTWQFPVKNFFVHDKKKNFYLITVHLDHPPADMAALSKQLGAKGRFSFAKPEQLLEKLKVTPGSVSPFCIVHDVRKEVQVVLDERLQSPETAPTVSAHPLINTQTTTLQHADFMRLYSHTGHEPIFTTVPTREVSNSP